MRAVLLLALCTIRCGGEATRCGAAGSCAADQTCATTSEHAGRLFACAPTREATICPDARFSCPRGFECRMSEEECYEPATGRKEPLQENVEATGFPLGSSTMVSSFCNIVVGTLPSTCDCIDENKGGKINCRVLSIRNETVGAQLDVRPCDYTMHMDIKITEEPRNMSYKLAGVKAGTETDIPVPGVSIDIPKIGDAGIDLAVKMLGTPSNVRLFVGLNACGQAHGIKFCGSSLTKYLPFWIMHGDYQFSNFCQQALEPSAEFVV